MSTYLDTSALAKWYLNEPRSDDFAEFIQELDEPVVSSLTVVEMRSLLARHRRIGQLDEEMEAEVFATFQGDLRHGYLLLRSLEDNQVLAAAQLLVRLKEHHLRTLDALHLAACIGTGGDEIATADRVMAEAAEALGLQVVRFD